MNAYEFIVKMKDYASSELKQIARSAGVADKQVDELNRSGGRMGQTFSKLKGVVAGVFATAAVLGFTNKIIDARAEYEKFQAVLTTASGDRGIANSQLKMLTDFASTTPFQLNELTGSFVKLVNRGFIPVKNELTSLGDLAASQGKGFDQLSEALLDAETGEFERLKEFGIKASKAGDQVSFSFKGVTKTVRNNSDAIRDAIMQYGNMQGVAGAMESISKTLGGRISNLKDQWNNFLVAVGGESGGVFTGVIDILSAGLGVLTTYLPEISQWFRILWSYIEPVGIALWDFIKAAFGFEGAGEAVGGFGDVMRGVLFVVDIFTTGLTTLIGWLTPFADAILYVGSAWFIWNQAVAVFNALMLANPITWVIIGIMALIGVIGLVVKYTKGWGDQWKFTTEGAKLIFEAFVLNARAGFMATVNGIMIGLEMIQRGWYRFKESVGMGESDQNQKMIQQISDSIEQRKKLIADGYKAAGQKAKQAVESFGITIDTEAIKKDWQSLKDRFSGLGEKTETAPGSILGNDDENGDPTADPAGGTSTGGAQTIVSGGTRRTEINITIQKLQDDTKIFVNNTEEGLSSLGEKTQEILLRAINSINQMQTS